MTRRGFIAGVAGAATWPLALQARQTGLPIVGYLGSGSPDDQVYLVDAVLVGLKEAGYAEGQNIRIEYRWSEGYYDQLRHFRKI
jgi:putative ABC transport system substrate-binding protein